MTGVQTCVFRSSETLCKCDEQSFLTFDAHGNLLRVSKSLEVQKRIMMQPKDAISTLKQVEDNLFALLSENTWIIYDSSSQKFLFRHKINFPEPYDLPPPPNVRNVDTTHGLLRSLGLPGGDCRLIDYPMHRPLIALPAECFTDNNHVETKLLHREYKRLCDVFRNLGLPIDAVLNEIYESKDEFAKKVKEMFKMAGFGEYDNKQMLSKESCDKTINLANVSKAELATFNSYFSQLTDAIKSLTPDQQVNFADYYSQLNALLGETNLPASAAMGWSVNTQLLISTESALHAMFYIVTYIIGDMLPPAQMLEFIEAARERCRTYKGSAPPGETADSNDHPLRRLTQVISHGPVGIVEFALQQCALNNAGLPPHLASSRFSFVFTKPLMAHVRAKNAHKPCDDIISQQVGRGLAPNVYEQRAQVRTTLAFSLTRRNTLSNLSCLNSTRTHQTHLLTTSALTHLTTRTSLQHLGLKPRSSPLLACLHR